MIEDQNKQELIANHQRIKLRDIDVLRRMNLTLNDCADAGIIRRFCASKGHTLPDMIEIEVLPYESPDHGLVETFEWHINVYENPNETEGANLCLPITSW